ncbi:hypothetical protein [uncultured Akkermansia sp.]|uniref:hypothetical protein n=1 Tax=uncultured Akkermansia sp. TaxID=512294 RepID=UPI00265D2D9F|nr:hypothetical protein [uncultured Akkermansia sp.]
MASFCRLISAGGKLFPSPFLSFLAGIVPFFTEGGIAARLFRKCGFRFSVGKFRIFYPAAMAEGLDEGIKKRVSLPVFE